MEKTSVNEGVNKGGITYNGETFTGFVSYGFFNVFIKWRYADGANGISYATRQINEGDPQTFEQATRWIYGLLKPLGQGVPGFQSLVDAWIVPAAKFEFTSDIGRDAWLLKSAFDMAERAARRNGDELPKRPNQELRETFTRLLGHHPNENFAAWMEEQIAEAGRANA